MPAKNFLVFLLVLALPGSCAFAARDTLSVYFPFNKSSVTARARQELDAAIYKGSIVESQPVQIIGYTDKVGAAGYNLRLSRQRASSVKDYLIQSGFRPELITLITGKGEEGAQSTSRPDGNPPDRRVDIVKGGALPPKPQKRLAPAAAKTTFLKTRITAAPALKASVTDISKIAEGVTLVLDKIYFYPGRHIVRRESDEALDDLAASLQENPAVRVSIEGHVCCISDSTPDAIDDDTRRMELSVNRARAIRDYLVERGVAAKRLEFTGFGHRHPIIPVEHTEEEADQNRRVEIRVIR